MPHLGQSQQSGLTPVGTTPTELVQIPLRACQPCHLCVRNVDAAAIVYIKTGSERVSSSVSATDYGVVLNPGESYDWGGSIPRGTSVMGVSTVAASLVSIEANWCDISDEGHL